MYEDKTKKNEILERFDSMVELIKEFRKQKALLLGDSDYTQQYKEKALTKLVEENNVKIDRKAGAITHALDTALSTIGGDRQKAIEKRNEQGYNIQFQNALQVLQLSAKSLSAQEIEDLIKPFSTDSIAMSALNRAAVIGGMDSILAGERISYHDNPAIGVLEALKKIVKRFADAGVDSDGDYFSNHFAFITLCDSLADDLLEKQPG